MTTRVFPRLRAVQCHVSRRTTALGTVVVSMEELSGGSPAPDVCFPRGFLTHLKPRATEHCAENMNASTDKERSCNGSGSRNEAEDNEEWTCWL